MEEEKKCPHCGKNEAEMAACGCGGHHDEGENSDTNKATGEAGS